jgi:hypothetical protein
MTQWHQILVIEIITHLIRIKHFCGNELPTDMANPIAEREFITGIDPEAVSKRQSPAGFLNDRPPISTRDQERSDAKKKKRSESHEWLGWFEISNFRARPNYSISSHPESISKNSVTFHKRSSALCRELG